MRVTFLIPSLNEAEGIQETLKRIPRKELDMSGHQVDVLVVDGASRDGTAERARELGARVIIDPRPGYGRAYKTGFAEAKGDVVITGDADDSYPFEDTPRLLARFLKEGLDFVTVNRYAGLGHGAMSRLHRIGNFALNLSGRMLFQVRLRDTQSGMWILNRRARERLPFDRFSDGMPFSEELKIRAFRDRGLRSAEFGGSYRLRRGEKKLASWRDGFKNLGYLVALRFQRTTRKHEKS